jgi:hypothetical protein
MIHGASCICNLPIKERTTHFYPQLQKICSARGGKKRALLEKLPNCLVRYVSDCCKGILHRHIRFSISTYKKLKKFKNNIVLLADKKTSLKAKRGAIAQKNGGFLSLILPALASAVFGLIGNLVSKTLIK